MSNVVLSNNHIQILAQVFPAVNKFLKSVNARDISNSGLQRSELRREVYAAFSKNGVQPYDLDGIWISTYNYANDVHSFSVCDPPRVSVGMEYNIDGARWQFSGGCIINPDGSLKLEHVNVHRHADAISFVIL